jgi:hypothetical protein
MSGHASSLIDIYFANGNRGFIVGGISKDRAPSYDNLRPVILQTEDGGRTWVDRIEEMRSEFVDGTWGLEDSLTTRSATYRWRISPVPSF